jgi:hypothetical protein
MKITSVHVDLDLLACLRVGFGKKSEGKLSISINFKKSTSKKDLKSYYLFL